ncbi:ribosome maturation factor RimP [Parafilimonas sp.]|uniref:ribosome maturation factor RimP n=1 Tax=Parafilimonas sp. TaxID=1969739 RepID=UPI0039E27598
MEYVIHLPPEIIHGRERSRSLLFLPYMNSDSVLNSITQIVSSFLENEPGYFLVEIKIKPTNNVKIFIDGDNGISIDKCVQFNRQLYKMIESHDLFPSGDFSLEVSSPGIDKPLKLQRQYVKNVGRNIEVSFNDGSSVSGRLLQVSNDDIMVEQTTGKGKKAETTQLVIPFSNIKTTTVQIEF